MVYFFLSLLCLASSKIAKYFPLYCTPPVHLCSCCTLFWDVCILIADPLVMTSSTLTTPLLTSRLPSSSQRNPSSRGPPPPQLSSIEEYQDFRVLLPLRLEASLIQSYYSSEPRGQPTACSRCQQCQRNKPSASPFCWSHPWRSTQCQAVLVAGPQPPLFLHVLLPSNKCHPTLWSWDQLLLEERSSTPPNCPVCIFPTIQFARPLL